jgi:hypothetical protein
MRNAVKRGDLMPSTGTDPTSVLTPATPSTPASGCVSKGR